MLYKGLAFPKAKSPYFYSNFVATLDGKTQVLERTADYWPLGSKLDYKTLIELRTYADVLIHGSATALAHPTLNSLSKEAFHKARKKTKHTDQILYMVITNHPSDDFFPKLATRHPLVKTIVLTSRKAHVSAKLEKITEIVRLGKSSVDLKRLPKYLEERGLKHILVEGGPTLMGSFFKANLIDEVFLTIAPKVVGDKEGQTLTMVEDFLYPPSKVPSLELVSCRPIDNEVYLRYRITKSK